ncbi:MAG TPA: hypothetical protein VFZ80_02470 [Acidimicrobiia bacterium]
MSRLGMPDIVPVLSRGKHRSPRSGACFMEYASFLAGERWSDHPKCTHPLLAGVARDINDHISDDGRATLVPLIPSVIGLNSDDPLLDVIISTRCALLALPVAAEYRQRALAAGLLAARRVIDELSRQPAPRAITGLLAEIEQALAATPHATKWAEGFVADTVTSTRVFCRRSAPNIVHVAVEGIAEACVRDPASLLADLLTQVIAECRSWIEYESQPKEPTRLHRRGAEVS